MAGYPPGGGHGYGYGYPGQPPQPYGYASTAPPYQTEGAAPGGKPSKPPKDSTGSSGGYPGAPPAGVPYQAGYPPPPGPTYGSPFAALMPSAFPPGTDPNVVACFQAADQDGSGFIDDKELQRALSSYNQIFSLRTVHLLMYLFTNSNARKIVIAIEERLHSENGASSILVSTTGAALALFVDLLVFLKRRNYGNVSVGNSG